MSSTASERFATRTLADLAATHPGVTAVFHRHKLDFCCGGRVGLAEAATAKGLDLGVLEAELEAVVALGLPDAVPEETGALIDLIETRFHAGHRRELPELLRLARRTEAAHRAHALAPHGIAALLGHIQEELEAHMQKEEQVLFPMMRRGGHPMIGQPIAVLLAEHDGHGAQLRALERVAHGFEPLEEACPTWRALYVGARRLSEEVMEHIHLENNVLFPRFAA